MNSYYKYIKLLILFVILSISMINAECPSHQIDDFTIDELYFNKSIVGYYLGGFDISSGSSNVLLFEYLISGPADCYDGTLDLQLHYDIEIFSPSLGFLTPTPFVNGEVKFTDIYGPVRIKNTDINFNIDTIEGAIGFDTTTPNVGVSDEELESMANYIMSTGKVPNGTYVFKFDLKNGGTLIDSHTIDVEIYEPTFLDILSPGYKNISDAQESPIFNSYPVFTWNADMCSSCNYGIRVCEYDQSNHSSFSEALNDISSLPSNQSEDYQSIPSGSLIFQYPSSGAFDLEAGKFYVWQVKRDYGTTVGVKEDYSDIFIFKISSFESSESSNLDFLKELLGEDNFSILFGPGGELEGFDLSGVILDGEQSSEQDIQDIITAIQQGNKEVFDYSID